MPHKEKRVPPRTTLAVSVSVNGDHNATAACATILGGPYTRNLTQAAGSAKRNAGDPYNSLIALDLAVGRALVELGLRLQSDGEELVQLQADTRFAEKLLADVRRTQRAARRIGPHPGLLPLAKILAERGVEAAETAAARRGQEPELAEILTRAAFSDGGRDNGLPTIKSDTKENQS